MASVGDIGWHCEGQHMVARVSLSASSDIPVPDSAHCRYLTSRHDKLTSCEHMRCCEPSHGKKPVTLDGDGDGMRKKGVGMRVS
jgi:hypothetical protein